MALRFDLSSIPSTSKIKSAELKIYKYGNFQAYKTSALYSVFTISKKWDVKNTNWTKCSSTEKWNTVGGDFEKTPLASFRYDGKSNGWFTFSMTKTIEDLVKNPASNLGFFVDAPDTINKPNGLESMEQDSYFHSSEAGDKSLTPRLVVTYDNPTGSMHKNHLSLTTEPRYSFVKNTLYIAFSNRGTYDLSLKDVHGRTVAQKSVAVSSKQWIPAISNISHGYYVLTLLSESAKWTKKLIHF